LSIFKLPHCDCKNLHAESKLCVEGLNIAARERKKVEEKSEKFEKGEMKMKLHLSDIIQRYKMKAEAHKLKIKKIKHYIPIT
jgi:hypothetical protein